MIAQPHELLRVDATIARRWNAPPWVTASLERAPWVVVRRAWVPEPAIAVGVRGATRAERYAASLARDDVVARLRPAELVARIGTTQRPLESAARAVAGAAREHELAWGPTGAYGFELATGRRVTHAASDLDGVVAVAPRATLASFHEACLRTTARTGVRIDVEVALGSAGVALEEYLGDGACVLAKTRLGAALVPR